MTKKKLSLYGKIPSGFVYGYSYFPKFEDMQKRLILSPLPSVSNTKPLFSSNQYYCKICRFTMPCLSCHGVKMHIMIEHQNEIKIKRTFGFKDNKGN